MKISQELIVGFAVGAIAMYFLKPQVDNIIGGVGGAETV